MAFLPLGQCRRNDFRISDFRGCPLGAAVPTLLRMAGNVAIETVIGAVPIVGDLFDIVWKANLKNLALVRGHVANAGLP